MEGGKLVVVKMRTAPFFVWPQSK